MQVADALPATMYIMLGTFVFMLMPVGVVVVLLHKRSALSLLGPLPLAIRQFAVVLPVLALLGFALLILPPWDMGAPLAPNLALGTWLLLLPFSLLAVLVQVSAEEVFFRGYVQQQLAARFRSPLIWMIFPSALFALGHYLPEEAGSNAMMIAIWAGVFGVLMADITARAGSLGPAIAIHFYNNFMAIVVVSVPDDLSGLAGEMGPVMRDFFTEMGPAFAELLGQIDDLSNYHLPEMLPNGDIIIRRKVPLKAEPEPETEIEI